MLKKPRCDVVLVNSNKGNDVKWGSLPWVIMCALAVAGVDQMSKRFVVHYVSEGEIIPIINGIFNLTLSYNRGAAFGFLSDIENPMVRQGLLWTATGLALVAVLYLYFKEYREDSRGRFGLALVLGGALGNMVDRFLTGQVVDFLDFIIFTYDFPIFNIADSALTIGVFLFIIVTFLDEKKAKKGHKAS